MIKIGKYSIKEYDKCNPFTVYVEYTAKTKQGDKVLRHKPIAYLNTLEQALASVYHKLLADSELVDPKVAMDLQTAIKLLQEQLAEFKTIIKDTGNDT